MTMNSSLTLAGNASFVNNVNLGLQGCVIFISNSFLYTNATVIFANNTGHSGSGILLGVYQLSPVYLFLKE